MPNPLLVGWLRRAQRVEATSPWVLRGSLVMWATCPGARVPADLDYLLPGTAATFDPERLTSIAHAVAAIADEHTALEVLRTEVIFGETASPGLRVFLRGHARAHVSSPPGGAEHALQLDLAVGDPMAVAPRSVEVPDVGPVSACALETLFGWKLHGRCEFGRGRWRAKDLFDLELLWRHGHLDLAATRAAVALAFSSRGLPLSALDDFRLRDSWGTSRGGRQKWRALHRRHPDLPPFTATRTLVRQAIAALLDAA